MKTALFVLMLSTAAIGQSESACTTLYHHGDQDIMLCHVGDAYTKTELTHDSAREVAITEKTYKDMMIADTEDLQARLAQLKAVQEQTEKEMAAELAAREEQRKAWSITDKKKCAAAGFTWSHGSCLATQSARPTP